MVACKRLWPCPLQLHDTGLAGDRSGSKAVRKGAGRGRGRWGEERMGSGGCGVSLGEGGQTEGEPGHGNEDVESGVGDQHPKYQTTHR